MIQAYSMAQSCCRSYSNKSLTRKEYHSVKNEIATICYNYALSFPILYECFQLTTYPEHSKNFSKQKLTAVVLSLLIEDALLDEVGMNSREITTLLRSPSQYIPVHALEKIMQCLLLELAINTSSREQLIMNRYILKLHHAQSRSMPLKSKPATVLRLTKMKGLWLPIGLLVINPNISSREFRFFQLIGTWLKLVDDQTDVEKDICQKHPTLFTLSTPAESKILVKNIVRSLSKHLSTLPYSCNAKQKFQNHMQFLAKTFTFVVRIERVWITVWK